MAISAREQSTVSARLALLSCIGLVLVTFLCPAEALPPMFTNINGSSVIDVSELEPIGYVIITLSVTDPENDTTVISIENDGSAPIEIPLGTDELRLNGRLDFETTPRFQVSVRVDEVNGPFSDVVTFFLNVLNETENDAPIFNITTDNVTLPEESRIGTIVPFVISATDPLGLDPIVWSLSGPFATPQVSDPDIFNIDANSGEITLKKRVDIDMLPPGTVFSVNLKVTAGTRVNATVLALTFTDINDNAPRCNPVLQYADMPEEDSSMVLLANINCTDADSSMDDNNVLSFRIVQGNTSIFELRNTSISGQVSLWRMSSIDYETVRPSTDVLIRVMDGNLMNAMSTTATVVVVILPKNDNAPRFVGFPTNRNFSVNENSPVQQLVTDVSATDDDVDFGDDITPSLFVMERGTGNPEPDLFFIRRKTPTSDDFSIFANPFLDYDQVQAFEITVTISDGDFSVNSSDIITVTVLDVNDNAPQLSGLPSPPIIVNETDAKNTTAIFTASAFDADDPATTTFSYMVNAVIGNSSNVGDWQFGGSKMDMLQFARDFDLDMGDMERHILRILVTDGGRPELTGTGTLTIDIQPDNEFPPNIASTVTSVQVDEKQPAGTFVSRLEVTDGDTGDEGVLAFDITGGNTDNAFAIDAMGNITTQLELDINTEDMYMLTIEVSDSGNNPMTVTTNITINVIDVNDHPPRCTFGFMEIEVPENSTVDGNLTMIDCMDEDPTDVLTYIVRPPVDSIFEFLPMTSNQLVLSSMLDYEVNQTYDVMIDVSDGNNTVTVIIRVKVEPVNEHMPQFAMNETVSIPENMLVTNPFLMSFTATDGDLSPHDIVSYSIRSVSNNGMSLFQIDGISGALFLLSELDYESLPMGDEKYEIVIEAVDGGGWVGVGMVTVMVLDANDRPPVCMPSFISVDVNETETGNFTLSMFNCTDLENGTAVTYNLTQPSSSTDFVVSGDELQLAVGRALDFENQTLHVVTVEAIDGSVNPMTSMLTILVNVINQNDGPPVFASNVSATVPENSTIGSSVIDVTATDPDGDDLMFGDPQYSIVAGDPMQMFTIDAATGRIFIRKQLDFEMTPNYTLTIKAMERSGMGMDTVQVEIIVTDVDDELPTCNPSALFQIVNESVLPVPVDIDQLSCTDDDTSMLTYTITSGDTTLFTMRGDVLVLTSPLDFELEQSHSLVITVSDGVMMHDFNVTALINVLSVDEGPPMFSENIYMVNVSEGMTVTSSPLINVNATDPDSPVDQNGQIVYSFAGTYPLFSINSMTGEIFLVSMLDRETTPTHELIVMASDASNSSTATVSIVVTDVNDNSPMFTETTYRAFIPENSTAGTSIATVNATDMDDPNTNDHGTVMYSIEGGNSNFTIDPVTGVITNTKILDADPADRTVYTFAVLAIDSRGSMGSLTSTAQVTVIVRTVNQFPPMFMQSDYNVTINETEFSVGDVILNVMAQDNDTGSDGNFRLDLVSNHSQFFLSQNGVMGEIRLLKNLDFDAGDRMFVFTLTATDQGMPAMTGTTTVTVLVNDVNDNPPVCTSFINVVKVENETEIAQLNCRDIDPTFTLAYKLLSVMPNTINVMISMAGKVTVDAGLDYENSPMHAILIEVSDGNFITNVTVNLIIVDVNDNMPSFSGPLQFNVSETDMATNMSVYQAMADGNDGPMDTVMYSLNDTEYFEISKLSGEIYLKGDAPDRETEGATYMLEVCAVDTPNPMMMTTCETLTVNIMDMNDETPMFIPAIYSSSVEENMAMGHTLMPAVTVIDNDESPMFRNIQYSIIDGNSMGLWRINSNGEVMVNGTIDAEANLTHSLIIQASDGVNVAQVSYFIQVMPLNEFPPVFTPNSTTVSIPENTQVLSVLNVSFTVMDDDVGRDGEIMYSISSGPFSINPMSGQISLLQQLDRELIQSYSLEVRATDMGRPSMMTGTMTLTVEVTDVNDESPTCTSNLYSARLVENAVGGTQVTSLACQDNDNDPAMLNNKLSYMLTSGETDKFEIDNNGVIRVKNGAQIDREIDARFTLQFKVSDMGQMPLTTDVTVAVNILDENDNDPMFKTLFNKTVPEDTSFGTEIGSVSAMDMDAGMNAEIVYTISNGNSRDTFGIDPLQGVITLEVPLDFEMTQMYELEITAMDRGFTPRMSSATVTVMVTDINDMPPMCQSPYFETLMENVTMPVSLANINCTDIDTINLTYSISNGNSENKFMIDTMTGEVTTVANPMFDHEMTVSYLLEITITDGMNRAMSFVKVSIVDVNEHHPTFEPAGPYTVPVMENATLGQEIFKVMAADMDPTDRLLFMIMNGPSSDKFLINPLTGVIQLQSTLDYEMMMQHDLTIEVIDSAGQTNTTMLTVQVMDVNDNRPMCQPVRTILSVPEDQMTGSLFTPNCTDADRVASPAILYRIVSGRHSSLSLDTNTGELTLQAALDYEMAVFHELEIEAYDDGMPSMSSLIHIRINIEPVNEFTPMFMPSNMYGPFMVAENAVVGMMVGDVTAMDQDQGQQHGMVRYSIVGGNVGQHFVIDEMSGVISVAQQLDREGMDNFNLTVRATDDMSSSSSKSADAQVHIMVTDVNDNAPIFSESFYSGFIFENETDGTSVVTVMATDNDDMMTDMNGVVMYAIDGMNTDFEIDPMNGLITNKRVLDADPTGINTYTFSVIAVDRNGTAGSLTSTAQVTVTVRSVNQFPPMFVPDNVQTSISETQLALGDIILMVTAQDNDTGIDGEFVMAFSQPQTKFFLTQNGKMGEIRLMEMLDFDMGDQMFVMEVMATDKGMPAMTGTATVTIRVTDINDNPPMCPTVIYVDRMEMTTNITQVLCPDRDTNTTLSYTIISVTPNTIAPVVSADGHVTVNSPLDYENDVSHSIQIQVEDGLQTASVTINLFIMDVNDNPPSFRGSFNFTVMESDMPSNTPIHKVEASSNDGPMDKLVFSLNDTTYFDISADTGEIYLRNQAPDFETVGDLYMLGVCVMDTLAPMAMTACQTLMVTVLDVDDMRPVFNPTVYSVSVSEDVTLGQLLMPVMATDGDSSPAFHNIIFSIIQGNAQSRFRILGNGSIEVALGLDYEMTMSYQLIIQAMDTVHMVNATYNIQVMPVNEHTPIFTPMRTTVKILENVMMNHMLIEVSATDDDMGPDGMITYSIDSGPFSIEPMVGRITVIRELDREMMQSYTLIVRATDQGMPRKTGSMTLTVEVEDVNDNSPMCGPTFYAVSVMENVNAGHLVLKLNCTDADMDPANMNNKLMYTLSPMGMFEVDALGVIRVQAGAMIDREMAAEHSITVEVSDSASSNPRMVTIMVNITVMDVNDEQPIFTNLPSVTISENTTLGTTVAQVRAMDKDAGMNGEILYTITGGNIGNHFRLDSSTGNMVLQAALDFEQTPMYMLEITAMDRGIPPMSVSGTVTVSLTDVNDSPPMCPTSLYVAELPENATDMMVSTVSCSDMEGMLTYSITGGDPGGVFMINSTTGMVSMRSGAVLDFEKVQSYLLEITASDGMQQAQTSIKVTVTDINEFQPMFDPPGPYNIIVHEDTAVGSVLFQVNATDRDIMDTSLLYSIESGNGDRKFVINANSGIIQLQGELDYEMTMSYTLMLSVKDSSGVMAMTMLNIQIEDVNDNNPVCNETFVAVSVDEGKQNVAIFTPACTDMDVMASPTLSFMIESGSLPAIMFDPQTGALSLTSMTFDYEVMTSHDVVIKVSDNGSPMRSTSITVRININPINEETPMFVPDATYGPQPITESATVGTPVIKVSASDKDMGQMQGTVRYSIISGDPQQQFLIEETTGQITVAKLLDREDMDSYTLTVRAMDSMPGAQDVKMADATVTIEVTDVNDMTPVFMPTFYSVDVLEGSFTGFNVTLQQLTVQDDDMGMNSELTISIVAGNMENKFAIEGKRLILIDDLDYETTIVYVLELEVRDNGSPPLKSMGRVVVNVQPRNDRAPLMTSSSETKTIPEDTAVGTLVFDANATDADRGLDGQVTYSIASGVPNNDFLIDPMTGELFVGSALDFDTAPTSYAIILQAKDGSGLSSTVSLSIILSDVNDNMPMFSRMSYTFMINENVAIGSLVDTLTVSDGDSGVSGEITLSIIAGTGMSYFMIDSSRREIRTIAEIDYEMNQILYLTVRATDAGSPAQTSDVIVKININNMNDNPPMISPTDLTISVDEDEAIGSVVYTFMATDKDQAIDAFTLDMAQGSFMIDPSTGEVKTTSMLDREMVDRYVLMIQVLDQPTPVDSTVNTATATLTILVGDINDNTPIILGSYSTSLTESAPVRTLVFQIQAMDMDSGINGQLTYLISSGNTNDDFLIDASGNILVAKTLDTDRDDFYALTVIVSDSGTPRQSASTVATIRITNVNDPPVFSMLSYVFEVDENSGVGTFVGRVMATDNDAGASGTVTYSLGPFSQGPAHFSIGSGSGNISVASSGIDFEQTSVYMFKVMAMDGATPVRGTAMANVTINVKNKDESQLAFSPTIYAGSVIENSDVSTSIVQLRVTAPEVTTTTTNYNILQGMMDGSQAVQMFQVDSNGLITPRVTTIDYESVKSFNFQVSATRGTQSDTANVTIMILDANDNPPTFAMSFINAEVATSGNCQEVTTVSSTDADTGVNAETRYSLDNNADLFTVDRVTGVITLTESLAAGTKLELMVRATNTARGQQVIQLSDTATVRVDVFDPNLHVIIFRLTISRTDFEARRVQFIAQLQLIFRRSPSYPRGLIRLLCVQEYDGQATSAGSSSVKKRQAARPVEVLVYAVQDDLTNALANLNQVKVFLPKDDLFNLMAQDSSGTPNSDVQAVVAVTRISPFRLEEDSDKDSDDSWWDTIYGPVITAVLIALALILLGILIYCCCCRHGKDNQSSDRKSMSSDPMEIPRPEYAWRNYPGYRELEYGAPYNAPIPIGVLVEDVDDFHSGYKPRHNGKF